MKLFRDKKRKAVKFIEDQDPNTLIREHIFKQTDADNVLVSEYDVIEYQKSKSWWMRDLLIPRWLLLTLASLTMIIFTVFAIFAAVVSLNKQLNGDSCKSNADCRSDLGLICNNYRCGCAYSHFWSDTYDICERRRMINRTCTDNSICDVLANLECQNVTLASGSIQLQCQCEPTMSWNGYTCAFQGLYNASCLFNYNCDNTRYLFCNSTLQLCRCNSSMFWNGDLNLKAGTCEYKRTIGQYCYPYDDSWCDDTGPIGQGLTCTQFSNPYGSEYGVCQCSTHEFYNGSASLANGFCVPQRVYNQSCTSTSQCDYRINLTCLNDVCLCTSGQSYNSLVNSSGVLGSCVAAAGYGENCTASILCSSSQNLYCDFSYYGGANTSGVCLCNSSWSYWDRITCASKLSIGGECTSNTQCISAYGLFCSNYTQSVGTCDCDRNHFWNSTCIIKQWFNTSCTTGYVCDDNRGLLCQSTGGALFQKCDCYNTSFIWDSLYVTRSDTCILKLGNGQSPCYGNLECQDFNYLYCDNTTNTCVCLFYDYWDGTRCQPKRNYTDPCVTTNQCRDFSPVNLVCRAGPSVSGAFECLCSPTAYWDACLQRCVTTKKRQQPCTITTNCSSNECDITANLQCINDSVNNQTGSGWCNCTSLQWWNGTYCRNKGTPSWGVNSSDVCNATYQCADYDLVSCPFGQSSVSSVGTCECATTKYWNGLTCIDRVLYGQSCVSWTNYPDNTTTCLSAAGAGLLCSNIVNNFNGTYAGTCYCPSGTSWNTTFLLCA